MNYNKILQAAKLFEKLAQGQTLESYIESSFIQVHNDNGLALPDDVRVRTTPSQGESKPYPIAVEIWSDAYHPNYMTTFDNQMNQRMNPNGEGHYEISINFMNSESVEQ